MKLRVAYAIAFIALFAVSKCAMAELESVEVGGEIKIRGNYFSPGYGLPFTGEPPLRWRQLFFSGRPVGLENGNLPGSFAWDKDASGAAFFNQRSTLHIKANFTDNVSTYTELTSYQRWGGGNFRSDYLTGLDRIPETGTSPGQDENLYLYQAYIEINNAFGRDDLRIRIGRQEMGDVDGDTLLYQGFDPSRIGNRASGLRFSGLSFDGLRTTMSTDRADLNVFVSKLAQKGELLDPEKCIYQDSSTYFAGAHLHYTVSDAIGLAGYYYVLYNAKPYEDTTGLISNRVERSLGGLDDYDDFFLHTLGARLDTGSNFSAGTWEVVADMTYQFGDAGYAGGLFKPYNLANVFFGNSTLFGRSRYGDDSATYGNLAIDLKANVELQNVKYSPKISLRGTYFGGEDNRDISLGEWAASTFSPFYTPRASFSYNRLFSDDTFSDFLDLDSSMSNVWIANVGVSMNPTEAVNVGLSASRYAALSAFRSPRSVRIAGQDIIPLFPFSFVDKENSKNLGWEVSLTAAYTYKKDLVFRAGWSHLFVGKGLTEGSFSDANGLGFNGGTGHDDVDYVYGQTEIRF